MNFDSYYQIVTNFPQLGGKIKFLVWQMYEVKFTCEKLDNFR